MRTAVAVLATASIVLLSNPAAAETRAEVLDLAERATTDEAALDQLRAIDEIDGSPVDLDRVLEGASGEEIEERVETLVSEDAAVTEPDAAGTREVAKRILDQDRYRPDEIPRPLRGPLEWIANLLEPVGDAIGAVFGWIAERFGELASATPGGALTLWMLIGLVVVAFVMLQTKNVIARRSRKEPEHEGEHAVRVEEPRDLERRAAAARASGDHELAVRLLFRAGLLRLARSRAIPARSSLTTGELKRILSLPEFDRLGISFDKIAYGRRPATEADSDAARSGWTRVLEKTAR